MVNLSAEVPSWFLPGYEHTWEETSWFSSGGQQTQMKASCFPPGHLPAQAKVPGLACPIPQCCPCPDALEGLLWIPLIQSVLGLEFFTQAEPTRRGPAPPARPPTAQEVCYRRAQQAQRESAGWLQAAQQLAEKPSSVHISAPGEKRRIAHVPNPLLAAGGSQRLGNAATSRESPGLAPALSGAVALSSAGWMSMLTCEAAPMLVGGAWRGYPGESKGGFLPSLSVPRPRVTLHSSPASLV